MSDAYKEYCDKIENNLIFCFRYGNKGEAISSKCNVNMEQVKEIEELIGVSWVLAKKEKKQGVYSFMKMISINVRAWLMTTGLRTYGEDSRVFTCKEVIGDERFIAIRETWKGKDEEMDLNVVRGNDNRLNSQVNIKETIEFNDFINDRRLVDIPMGGGRKFTRVSNDGVKFSKLGRFLLNDEFNNIWGNLSVIALDRKLSDHCPIVLKDVELDFSPKQFHIFNVLFEETNFYHVLEEAWKKEVRSSRPDCIFRDRLKNVKVRLRVWSKERFGGNREKIETLKSDAMRWELEAEKRTLSDSKRGEWLRARKCWVDKESEYCNMLRQKTRITWIRKVMKTQIFFMLL
ncbi:transposon TX1 [Tanacetum coccineum]